MIDRINGRVVIEREAYARLYVADSPINFRGEAERYSDHGLVSDLATAIADQGTFDFASYPLCGVIAAGGPSDARSALTSCGGLGHAEHPGALFPDDQAGAGCTRAGSAEVVGATLVDGWSDPRA